MKNPDRHTPRMPLAHLGIRFNGQFTEHFSGFLEYTYTFPQRKTAVSVAVREPRDLTLDDFEEGELLEDVDLNKYNPKQLDLSDDDILEEFKENVALIRLNEKNDEQPLIKKQIRESSTEGYHLLNLGVKYQRSWGKMDYSINLSDNNILNQKIYTHTSFLPYVPQMGRNYVLGLGVKF